MHHKAQATMPAIDDDCDVLRNQWWMDDDDDDDVPMQCDDEKLV